jgi:hypothetical protein
VCVCVCVCVVYIYISMHYLYTKIDTTTIYIYVKREGCAFICTTRLVQIQNGKGREFKRGGGYACIHHFTTDLLPNLLLHVNNLQHLLPVAWRARELVSCA